MRVVDKFDKQNTLSWVVQKILLQLAHAFHYIVSRLMRSKVNCPMAELVRGMDLSLK